MNESAMRPSLVSAALELQEQHESSTPRSHSKTHGQFFTPPSVASFMASLLTIPAREFRVLDAGAGSGILSAAVCDRVVRLRSPRSVHLVLYETDATVLGSLKQCLERCRRELAKAGHLLTAELHEQDFVLSAGTQGSLFAERAARAFDAVIMNPPYFKLSKDSQYSKAMSEVVHGQPNIYALFMALGADLLKPDGTLVAITPRSFCNGPYFRGFRRWFFQRMSLEHVHLFESRTDTFRHAKVLQESVITLTRRGRQTNKVAVTTSKGQSLSPRPKARVLPAAQVLDDSASEMVLRIPEAPEDSSVIALVEGWHRRFQDLGLRVSTGPVVAFRARPFLSSTMNGNTVPLLSVHNVRAFETRWPVVKGQKPTAFLVAPESRSQLLPVRNYVLLRRFTAKEEHRRLVASCYLRRDAGHEQVALENHLNYVYHAERELSEAECLGLTALFNSALMDRYFRAISGNTQVNAAELRAMPLPPLRVVERIGRRLLKCAEISRSDAEGIVRAELRVGPKLAKYLQGHVR